MNAPLDPSNRTIDALVDTAALGRARIEFGESFARILGYFREDGMRAVETIERAMEAMDAVAMVMPAHTINSEARQFGALPLADLAETVEMIARDAVETRGGPQDARDHILRLRALFEATLSLLEGIAVPRATPPLFGRRRRL